MLTLVGSSILVERVAEDRTTAMETTFVADWPGER